MSTTAFRDTLYSDKGPGPGKGPAAAAGPKGASAEQAARPAPGGVSVRLVPAEGSDRAIVVNYANVVPATGMVFIDFGFLEPLLLQAFDRATREGKETAQMLDGRMATRVVMGYDVLAGLAMQLEQLLGALKAAAAGNEAK
jgi:hypothetical protein